MTVCTQCGQANRAIARFCIGCDASLPGGADAEVGETVTIASTAGIGATQHDSTTMLYGAAGPFTQTLAEPAAMRRTRPIDLALPAGTVIEGFRIVRTLGEGGFGIVYLAWDEVLERHVAIKEYMPSSLAVRTDAHYSVSVRSERYRDTFDAGLRSFVNEARLLARFDHPALVKVLRFWEANRTAYMAMPWYEGPTLKSALVELKGNITDAQIRAWLDPLLDALAVIHQENCFHRDISPDNILLTTAGPVLLDFGAARRAINDMTQAMTAVLKPGFAPVEQYGGGMPQGPWTDFYALGGVVHYAITGRPPPASVLRAVDDTLQPFSTSHAGRFSPSLLDAVDRALAVRPEARPQDVTAFRALLGQPVASIEAAAATAQPRRVAAPPTHRTSPPRPTEPAHARSRTPLAMAAAMVMAVGAAATIAFWSARDRAPTLPPTPTPIGVAAPVAAPASKTAVVAPTPAPTSAPTPAPASTTGSAEAAAPPAPDRTARLLPSATARTPVAAAPTNARAAAGATPVATQRTKVAAADPPAPRAEVKPQRCAEIVQKSSLEPLTPVEVSYLKKECR